MALYILLLILLFSIILLLKLLINRRTIKKIECNIYTIAIEPPLGCHAMTAQVRPFSRLIWAT